ARKWPGHAASAPRDLSPPSRKHTHEVAIMNLDSSINGAEFVKVGQATWDLGLNSLKSGNMSLLLPNRHILITKTGRSLRGLNSETDLIAVDCSETERGEASCEF